MEILQNPFRGKGLDTLGSHIPTPSNKAENPAELLKQCPAHKPTPLVEGSNFAAQAGIADLKIKDERTRMGLGSFKALGASYVIAKHAVATGAKDLSSALSGKTYITPSAGNHGMSVAAGARLFGAKAVIYLATTVPESFAERLREKGATVVIEGDDYEASMTAAFKAAEDNGWLLLSDTSWDEYTELSHTLMEGYLQLAAETAEEIEQPPTHIFLQAGVGGFAGAMAAYFRRVWADEPSIIIVEPTAAPALLECIRAGKFVDAPGPVSSMGRLDCKEASLIALKGLSKDADVFVTLSDEQVEGTLAAFADAGLETSASGGAGLSALMLAHNEIGLDASSRALCFITEGPA